MSERAHALLGASSADRWLNCPGSVLLTSDMPDAGSVYAEEGTQAHAVCEEMARRILAQNMQVVTQVGDNLHELATPEMIECAEVYTQELQRIADDIKALTGDWPYVALEQRVDFSKYVPDGFGTSDCIMVGGDIIHVVDYKHGKGVHVEAENNPQLMLYSLGALERYSRLYTLNRVRWSIVQPRNGGVSHATETTAEALRAWGTNVVNPVAVQALQENAPIVPGEWCRWCKAKGVCRARSDQLLCLEYFQKEPPKLLSADELGGILTRARDLSAWAKDVEDEAMNRLLTGAAVPGWKVVEGRSLRNWVDPDAAFRRAVELGVPDSLLFDKKPISLAQLESVMGKKAFKALDDLVTVPPGKPTLAPESDKRPAIASRPSAEQDFA